MNPLATRIAFALMLCAPAAMGASVCDGPCSISMTFPTGGSIDAPGGATITFGPEGGLLALGEGGAITLGDGGGVTMLENGLPDMSQGGTVQLGPGGAITFGNGGSLATGGQGGISFPDGSAFDVATTGAVTIDSAGDVVVGNVDIGGDMSLTSGGFVTLGDVSPNRFNVSGSGPDSDIAVTAGGDLTSGSLSTTAGNIAVTATNAFLFPSGAPWVGAGGWSAGGLCIVGNGDETCGTAFFGDILVMEPVTLDSGPTVHDFRVSNSDNAAGSMGFFGLLVGLAALGRRRR